MNLAVELTITKPEGERFYHLYEKRANRDEPSTFIGRYSGSEEVIKKAEGIIERRGGTITIDLRG